MAYYTKPGAKGLGRLGRLVGKEVKDRAAVVKTGAEKGVRNVTTNRSNIRKQNKATRARLGKTARGVTKSSKKR